MVGYFSVNEHKHQGFVDWEWLLNQPSLEEKTFTRLLRFDKPIQIKMNGHHTKGIIFKPGKA
jgi:hypothetical protein